MNHQKVKSQWLGANYTTAVGRLLRDLLFDFVVKAGHVCHRCGGPLTRDDFSVDHKDAWRLAENPQQAFFDKENIAYSHIGCNALHNNRQKPHGKGAYNNGCRCEICRKAKQIARAPYSSIARRGRYTKYGT